MLGIRDQYFLGFNISMIPDTGENLEKSMR